MSMMKVAKMIHFYQWNLQLYKEEEGRLASFLKKVKAHCSSRAAELSGHGTSKACLLHPAIFTLVQEVGLLTEATL